MWSLWSTTDNCFKLDLPEIIVSIGVGRVPKENEYPENIMLLVGTKS